MTALDDLTAAIARGSGHLLENLGVIVRLSDAYVDYAHEHQPHLLRSKAKRQRKRAIRGLGRTMSREHQRRAFQLAVMRKAEGLS